jgi:ATP-dependent Clp protease ATP-binding subunit ClpA
LPTGLGSRRELDETKAKGALERTFSPEFRNRLDAWILFRGLSREIILRVVDKEIRLLAVQLTERRVAITVTDAAREWLAEKGYDPGFGARPMARLIEDRIKRPLSEALLFGDLENGGAVTVDRAADGDDKGVKVEVVRSGPAGLLQ